MILSHHPARAIARRLPRRATPEHLLLALTNDADAAPVMRACHPDLEVLRASEAKNCDLLIEIGGRMDEVCESCHKVF